jgi:DMSO reductase family type II enzyme heme b subunit
MVNAYRVRPNDAALSDPASQQWQSIDGSELALEPTPLTAQPSLYIQAKWGTVPYGGIARLAIRAAHDGERLYFRLSWPDDTHNDGIRDTDQFADAAAVLFPVNGDAPLQSMGSPQAPVNAWYWRPDMEEAWSVTAQGTGTTRRTADPELRAGSAYSEGQWSVVMSRKLESSGAEYPNLAPGAVGKVAFAVWQGNNQERGGLKAVTMEWEPLEIEA